MKSPTQLWLCVWYAVIHIVRLDMVKIIQKTVRIKTAKPSLGADLSIIHTTANDAILTKASIPVVRYTPNKNPRAQHRAAIMINIGVSWRTHYNTLVCLAILPFLHLCPFWSIEYFKAKTFNLGTKGVRECKIFIFSSSVAGKDEFLNFEGDF